MSFDPRALSEYPRVLRALSCVCIPLVLALGVGACGKSRRSQLFNENLRPVVTVDSVAVDTTRVDPDTWSARITWSAQDADGGVVRLEYAVDPTAEDTSWVSNTRSPVAFTFPVRARNPQGYIEPEFRVVVLRVRDDRNELSPVLAVPVYAVNQPPHVTIVQPIPSVSLPITVPQEFGVMWEGDDPDGYPAHVPEGYRTRVVLEGDPLYTSALQDPLALLRDGEAHDWSGWSELTKETSQLVSRLANQQSGVFAIVAFDGHGGHSQVMAPGRNFFRFRVSAIGPSIRFSGGALDFTVGTEIGQVPPEIRAEVPAGRPLAIGWEVLPVPGSRVTETRWRLDPIDVTDDSERQTADDLTRWSPVLLPPVIVTLPPLSAGRHLLMVRVRDDLGRSTIANVSLIAVPVTPNLDLLIVDDTRREPDQLATGGCLRSYTKPWPSAAELDTFLYARGGVPWRCLVGGAVQNSEPGLFAGYSFDTTGTRRGVEDPSTVVPLSVLLRYRNVLWIVDSDAAQYTEALDQGIFPITALRALSQPGHQNSLQAYIEAGGHVWLAGGGAALASLLPYDVRRNNTPTVMKFSASELELTSARMMFQQAHVRSEIDMARVGGALVEASPAARGGWLGHGLDGSLGAPDYTGLPALMRARDPGIDPMPPTRTSGQTSLFYPGSTDLEFIGRANSIVEDMDLDPVVERNESTLDTLMQVSAGALGSATYPVMTYYHGRENGSVVFTGFSLWQWTRPDAQALVDFVLNDIWKLSRAGNPGASGPALQARPGPARVIGTRRGVR